MTKYKSFNGSESKLSRLQELVNFINENSIDVVSINYAGGEWVLIYNED